MSEAPEFITREDIGDRRSKEVSRLRAVVLAAAAIAIVVVLSFLASQMNQELAFLREAPGDKLHGELARLEVNLLDLDRAIRVAKLGDSTSLAQARRLFDLVYGRVAGMGDSDLFRARSADASLKRDRDEMAAALRVWVPLIDASDEALVERLPGLLNAIEDILPAARRISGNSAKAYAAESDQARHTFSHLLILTAATSLGLIVALAAAALVLLWQRRVSTARSREIEAISQCYASTINASLDAIIVSNAAGEVIDFNPAAERVFGYSRNAALGSDMGLLIVPEPLREAHRAGMRRLLATGDTRVVNRGRVTMDARRANGDVFPVELSLGMSSGPEGPIFIGYIRDISDQAQAQRELTTARDEALAAARAKSQFLAVMSHEMRTPLNGVLAMLDILESTNLSEKQTRFVRTAINSGELLLRHINDVLEITHLEASQLRLSRSVFELGALFRDIVAIHTPGSAARGNRIVLDIDRPETRLFDDHQRLSQVIGNLISNAVKFTTNGLIRVRVARVSAAEGGALEISVEDTGIGIAEADRRHIFEDFVTLDASYRRTNRGYGLGLAISRRIVQAMDGAIGVESEPGAGSRFWVRLPLREAPRDAAIPLPRKPLQRKGEGMRVLLVEDNETNRLVAREMLSFEGCLVTEAVDGAEGIVMASATAFDLILMDVSMPAVDGLEATRRIRADETGLSRSKPIVGLTAHALPEEQEKLREAGMQDCLIKPLRSRNLHELLNRFGEAPMTEDGSMKSLGKAGSDGGAASTPMIDLEVLDELREVLPPDVFAERMVAFESELASIGVLLKDFLSKSDIERVGKLAHKFAGAAALFGADPLRAKLAQLETAARGQDAASLGDLIQATEELSSATLDAISRMPKA